jgi:DNA repair protein RadC
MTASFNALEICDRPREKLIRYGPKKLRDYELLAILLGVGSRGKSVHKLAQEIMRKFKFDGLKEISFQQLIKVTGIASAKACSLVAAVELGKRLVAGEKRTLLLSAREVWNRMLDLKARKKEYFVVFFLDTQLQVIERKIVSIGILNMSLVHPREVFEEAIKHNAAQILVAHNHPSGSLVPSEADIKLTKRLCESGKILGVDVLDHVIVTKDAYVSMEKMGLM